MSVESLFPLPNFVNIPLQVIDHGLKDRHSWLSCLHFTLQLGELHPKDRHPEKESQKKTEWEKQYLPSLSYIPNLTKLTLAYVSCRQNLNRSCFTFFPMHECKNKITKTLITKLLHVHINLYIPFVLVLKMAPKIFGSPPIKRWWHCPLLLNLGQL